MEEAPFLLGYVKTRVKASALCPLITEDGQPLLVHQRCGLGKSIAFTSDVTSKWASEWLEWPNFSKFWSQCIRSVMRKNRSAGLSVKIENTFLMLS